MIRVLLAEDQDMVRGALAALLSLEPDIEVVAEVDRGDEVVARALEAQPHVALLDIEMPGEKAKLNRNGSARSGAQASDFCSISLSDGISVAGSLRRQLPGCRVLILTTFGRPGYLRRAMASGASGFLLKDAPAAQLAVAIRRTMAGERVLDPELAAQALSDGESPLSPREAEVLGVAAGGASVAQIARHLFLSEGTVRNHLSAAIQKLHVQNRMEAARIAKEKGWL